MLKSEFEQLVSDAIDVLPPVAQKVMDNVVFVVELEAREATSQELNISKDQMLLGLYQGISKANRGSNYFGVLPDKITIFQHPIEILANGDYKKIKEIVFDVVRHEVGHHLGFNEVEIRAYETKHRTKKV